MADKKFYVYSARTTAEGLKLLNATKDKLVIGWDKFINDAVAEKYGLKLETIALPPSEFEEKRKAAKAAKEAEKAAKAKAKEEAKAKKAAEKAAAKAPKAEPVAEPAKAEAPKAKAKAKKGAKKS